MDLMPPGTPASTGCIRIVVLDVDTELWCDTCAAFSGTAITYVVQVDGHVPQTLSRLVYCTAWDHG